MATVENISIQVKSTGADTAARQINSLVGSLEKLESASSSLTGVSKLGALGNALQSLSNVFVNVKAISSLAGGIDKLSTSLAKMTPESVDAIQHISKAISGLNGFSGSIAGVARGIESISESVALLSDEDVARIERVSSALASLNGVNLSGLAGASNVGKVARSMQSTAAGIRDVGNASKSATKHTGGFISSLKRIAMYRILRTIIKEIGQAFSEGLKNAYNFSKSISGTLASALDKISTKSLTMKNQMGAALGSLLESITPILLTIINLATQAAQALSALFAAIGGGQYLVANDVAQSWDKAAGAAGKYKNTILGFDEINRLDDPSGGGGGDLSASNMFHVEDLPGWAETIKTAFDNLKTDLTLSFQDIFFDWGEDMTEEDIASKIITLLLATAGGIFGLATGGLKGGVIGVTIGAALGLFISSLTFDHDGTLSDLEIDQLWTMGLGGAVGAILGGILGGFTGGVVGLMIGAAITFAINQILIKKSEEDPEFDLEDALGDIKAILIGAGIGAIVGTALGGIPGALIGMVIGATVTLTIKKVFVDSDGDPLGLMDEFFPDQGTTVNVSGSSHSSNTPQKEKTKSSSGAYLAGSGASNAGLAQLQGLKDAWKSVEDFFSDRLPKWWKNNIAPWFTSEKWSGLFDTAVEGFKTGWSKITTWWNDSALVKWWEDDVKKWFTVEQWSSLFTTALDGVTSGWNSIVTWWQSTGFYNWWENDVKAWFKDGVWSDLFTTVKTGFETGWAKVTEWWRGTGFANWWENDVKAKFASETWSPLFDDVKTGFATGWGKVTTWWNDTGIHDWWENDVKPWFSHEKWQGLWDDLCTWISGWKLPKPHLPDIRITWSEYEPGTEFGKALQKFLGITKIPKFDITWFADGGIHDLSMGSLFVAGEAGAEIVTNMGNGRTGVTNVEQMEAAVANGNMNVVNAVYAMANMIVKAVNEIDPDITLDGQSLAQQMYPYTTAYANRRGNGLVTIGGTV